MREIIFDLVDELIDHSLFELEFQHRAKSNPFSEKWINCTRTRARTNRLRAYLYKNILIIMESDHHKSFFNVVLKNFVHISYSEFIQDLHETADSGDMDIIYRLIHYRLTPNELFILFTNVLTSEHVNWPAILEHAFLQKGLDSTIVREIGPYLEYYIRFMDVLSSADIISLFDLDALKNTIISDKPLLGEKTNEKLSLYRDWPVLNTTPAVKRFPDFIPRLSVKLVSVAQVQPNH